MNPASVASEKGAPRGMTAIGIFLLFEAAMALLAGIALVWPGTILDRMWILNPRAYQQLTRFGKIFRIPFLLLSLALGSATVGRFNRRRWGWQLAVFIVVIQALGDLVNVLLGRVIEGGVGVALAGALLFYLLRANVKAAFEANTLPK